MSLRVNGLGGVDGLTRTNYITVCTPLQSVEINGPSTATVRTAITLNAVYTPTNATDATLLWDNGKTGNSAGYTWTEAGGQTVIVTATAACGVPITAVHTITVGHVFDVELGPDRTGSAHPNSIVTYIHVLTNTGTGPDTFVLTHTGSDQNWLVKYDTPISLGADQTKTIMVRVTVPAGVVSNTTETTIVTAASQADHNIWANATDTTTVGHVPGVEFGPDQTNSAHPGSTITYTHILTNTGNGLDTFVLTHIGSNQDWLVQYDTPISLGASQTKTIVVNITVPADVAACTVKRTAITAASQAGNNVWASITDTTTVIPPYCIYLPVVFKNHSE